MCIKAIITRCFDTLKDVVLNCSKCRGKLSACEWQIWRLFGCRGVVVKRY